MHPAPARSELAQLEEEFRAAFPEFVHQAAAAVTATEGHQQHRTDQADCTETQLSPSTLEAGKLARGKTAPRATIAPGQERDKADEPAQSPTAAVSKNNGNNNEELTRYLGLTNPRDDVRLSSATFGTVYQDLERENEEEEDYYN